MTPAISEQVRWTIADLEGFPDNGNRYEIIDGELFVTRAPHLDHQDVAGLLYAELLHWSIQSRLGKPYMAPGIIFGENTYFGIERVNNPIFRNIQDAVFCPFSAIVSAFG
jgi:Uma2 family endonuclease